MLRRKTCCFVSQKEKKRVGAILTHLHTHTHTRAHSLFVQSSHISRAVSEQACGLRASSSSSRTRTLTSVKNSLRSSVRDPECNSQPARMATPSGSANIHGARAASNVYATGARGRCTAAPSSAHFHCLQTAVGALPETTRLQHAR